jgi:serine/threonine-protein kinase
MGASDNSKATAPVPPDLLPLIRRSGVLGDREFEEVCGKVLTEEYPRDSSALAQRLVAEQVLTQFQASRLLLNKASGFVVGRYVIVDRLGEGSKGRVFKAQHKLMGRHVAIKIISPQLAARSSAVARFYREMRLLGRLDHPNIVRAFDADQVGDLLYIVMEYIAGRDLAQLLTAQGPLSPALVAGYMAQAASGLSHAHERGIVHRDIKPTNLLLGDDGQVKVLDLGLGALMEADTQASFATAAGYSVGTLNYMSPEQASGSNVDGRSDLFNLGCTMYHLLSGAVPYPGETVVECLRRRAKPQPVPITDVRPDLPDRIIIVLDKLMAYKAEARYQSAAEAAQALQKLATRLNSDSGTNRRSPAPAGITSALDSAASSTSEVAEPTATATSAAVNASSTSADSPVAADVSAPAPSLLWSLVTPKQPLSHRTLLVILGLLVFLVGLALGHASARWLLPGK